MSSMGSSMKTDMSFTDMRALAFNYRKATRNVQSDHVQGHSAEIGGQDFEVVSNSEKSRVSQLLHNELKIPNNTTNSND